MAFAGEADSALEVSSGTQGHSSGSSLWGTEAVRALRAPRLLAEAVPDEEALLASVRSRVGPYASSGALRHHLRNAHGKIGWCVNGYLREAVLASDVAPADFAPAAHAVGVHEETASWSDLPALPAPLWELVLSFLTAPDVRSAACACWALRLAAGQARWRSLYGERWGAPPLHGLPAPASALLAPPPPCWRSAYSARAYSLGALRCPACLSCPLAPVVYGFPAPALVTAQRSGRVLLGGDYLVDNDPAWACAACGLQWRTWPWARGGIPAPAPEEARVAGAGAGAGVHFAGEL